MSFLRSVDIFAGVSAEALDRMAEDCEPLELMPKDVLVRKGDEAHRLFIVVSGDLALLSDEDDRELVLHSLGRGDLIGEVAVLTGGSRTATVRARTACSLVSIPRQAFTSLVEGEPELRRRLTRIVSRRLRRSQLVAYLEDFLGDAEPEVLRDLEQAASWVSIRSGEVLFRQGDEAEKAFIVITGRLRVVLPQPDGGERVLNEVGAGQTVGEMALLSQSTRSATVYAIRDTDLASFPRSWFEELLHKHPQVMSKIARLIVVRLQDQTVSSGKAYRQPIHTVAVVPAGPEVPVAEFAARLAAKLATDGAILHLRPERVDDLLGMRGISQVNRTDPADIRLVQWLNEQESNYTYIVYEAAPEWSNWTERTINQADHVLTVVDATRDPSPGLVEQCLAQLWSASRAPRHSLVLLHPEGSRPRGTARWLAERGVDSHYHVHLESEQDFARLARMIAGRAVGLVLGGGGARGFAHIGVARALQEAAIPVDVVGGASMGSIIAGGVAMGFGIDDMLRECRQHCVAIFDPTLPLVSLLAGRKISRGLQGAFGDQQIEDLWVPFFAVSTNLTRAEPIIHSSGPLAQSIRASLSLPGIMPPIFTAGDLIVDGGLLNNLPIDVMQELIRGGYVIASDVSPEVDLTATEPFSSELSGWRVLWNRINPFASAQHLPQIHSLLMRATMLSSVHASHKIEAQNIHGLRLQLPVEEWGLLDFKSLDKIAALGYEASREPLLAWAEEHMAAIQ